MLIVPLFPALFANRLHADRTSHLRGSACLLPLICTQFSSELLFVAHFTVSRCYQSKIHPHIGTLVSRHSCSAFVLHSNRCLHWCSMCDSSTRKRNICSIHKVSKIFLACEAWSSLRFPIPVKTDAVFQDQSRDQSGNHDGQHFLSSYAFHRFGPIPAFNRLHTITYTAWITLSNAQQKIGCNNN